MRDFLKLPHKREDLEVVLHHVVSEYGRERCQIINFIVELEDFPAAIAMLGLEHLDIKSVNEFGFMELSI